MKIYICRTCGAVRLENQLLKTESGLKCSRCLGEMVEEIDLAYTD